MLRKTSKFRAPLLKTLKKQNYYPPPSPPLDNVATGRPHNDIAEVQGESGEICENVQSRQECTGKKKVKILTKVGYGWFLSTELKSATILSDIPP